MTRHTAYAVSPSGRVARYPFASFPHADAAIRWVRAHPETRVRFVPPLPEPDGRAAFGRRESAR